MERPDRKEVIIAHEQNPIFAVHWTAGIGQPATMWWLEGRVLLAGVGTRAEEWLLDRGAIAVGMLRFEGCGAETERAVQGGPVLPIAAVALVEQAAERMARRN